MLGLLYRLGFRKLIDYRIIGDYLDTEDGIYYQKKYIRKYYIKRRSN